MAGEERRWNLAGDGRMGPGILALGVELEQVALVRGGLAGQLAVRKAGADSAAGGIRDVVAGDGEVGGLRGKIDCLEDVKAVATAGVLDSLAAAEVVVDH
jgi:hypothetical protein